MLRALSLLAFVAVCAHAAPVANKAAMTPTEMMASLQEALPAQWVEFAQSIPQEEKVGLMMVIWVPYHTEEEALKAIQEAAPTLYSKAETVVADVQRKLDSLSSEPAGFIKKIVETVEEMKKHTISSGAPPAISILHEKGQSLVRAFISLSPAAKDDLAAAFPTFTSFVSHPAFEKFAMAVTAAA